MAPCFVADTLNRMRRLDDPVITTAVKEAASVVFAGTQATELCPLDAYCCLCL